MLLKRSVVIACKEQVMGRKIILVSRCSWTLYNFRSGLMRELKRRGDIVIGGGAGGDGFEININELGVPFMSLPIDKKGINPLADLRLISSLFWWYRRERPEIVHHFTIKPVIYGSIAARLANVPRIINTVTGLGYVFTADKIGWLRQIVERLYRISLSRADFTFFLNQDDFRVLSERGLVNPEKAGVLPGEGVDCDFFSSSHLVGSQSGDTPTFIMVSRLLRDKGVYEFVDAARLVRKAYANSAFWLLGRRDERNPSVVAKEDLERWQSEGIVEWLGEVEDVRPIVAKADVVVLPSFYREGVPRSLLEAAAMEKAVITTDAVGCREAVEHGRTGLLVPIKDATALANAMKKMLENPDMRSRMGREGRRRVKEQFDEKIVLEKILEVYGKGGSQHEA